jgi:hypothetical protein
MAKQQSVQKFVYKIHTSRLKKAKWDLTLPLQQARKNDEVISLADSSVLRWIDELNGFTDIDQSVNNIRNAIKFIKRQPISHDNKKLIKKLYLELDNLQFRPDYLCLIIDKKDDYIRANKGFSVNGVKYKRYLGTTGGIKNETIIYLSEKVYDEIYKRTENNRNTEKKLVPAKYEAYKALACSASIPVSNPNGILVVNDCVTKFIEDVIELDDTFGNRPKMTYIKDKEIELTDSDGYALILPSKSEKWAEELKLDYLPSGYCIRNSFCKGMLFTFDFVDFAKNVAHKEIVKDVWGNEHNINNIEVILTTSMLKLWDSYESIDDYLNCCIKNHYTFSVTKATPKILDNERNLNYQFIQSFDLTEEEIDKLLEPTIQEIQDILGNDYRKSILFLKGLDINEFNIRNSDFDFIKALTIDKRMINDPFVRSKIHQMIKKRINDAKVGVIKSNGNFQIISGDPYSLCQSIFGLEVTGLLKATEFYSKYWIDRNVEIATCFRAPMTCHNNIRLLNFKNTEEMQYWYKYMNTVVIFNSWDTTAQALNGADKDSDTIFTTNNPVLVRNVRKLPPIICVQRQAIKKNITEEDLILSNINGFGDEIGSTTNKITSMFERQAMFDKDSLEYKELEYRIICGQLFQQNAIDKIKGIVAKPINKEWYDVYACKITELDTDEDKELKLFNKSILADKKPYFMRYIYPDQNNKYNTYIDSVNKKSTIDFNMSLDELLKSNEQNQYIEYYYKFMPVGINDCLMNKICHKIENKFDEYLKDIKELEFDYSIIKSNIGYSNKTFNSIKKIYKDYLKRTQEFSQISKKERIYKDDASVKRKIMKDDFKKECLLVCSNENELCDIVIDLCYTKNNSKQFAWDICGETIIENLLKLNNYKYSFPIQFDDGDIEFGGYRFNMIEMECEEEE